MKWMFTVRYTQECSVDEYFGPGQIRMCNGGEKPKEALKGAKRVFTDVESNCGDYEVFKHETGIHAQQDFVRINMKRKQNWE